MVCNVFICRLYKEAKLFENVNFNCSELTPFDFTELNIYSGYNQILGNYKINMTKYNRVTPFNNMRISCPSISPNFTNRNNISIYNSC